MEVTSPHRLLQGSDHANSGIKRSSNQEIATSEIGLNALFYGGRSRGGEQAIAILLDQPATGVIPPLQADQSAIILVDMRDRASCHDERGALYLMIQNRIYRGEVTHKGNSYPGQHPSNWRTRRHFPLVQDHRPK